MPVPVPQLGSFDYVPETKVRIEPPSTTSIYTPEKHCNPQENLDWADLVTVDLSLYSTPEGKKQLAQTLINAIRNEGFLYVKNFNISQGRVNRQFALGKQFYELPLEEKEKYTPEGLGRSLLTI